MALAAAIDHVLGSVPSAWETQALDIHPGYGELFETVAHFYIITRRYREAIAQLERAVEIDPELWSAHATLGINLLRVNRFDEGRRTLAKAHDGDPYNVEVVSTLRLLDSLDGWRLLADDDVIMRIHPDEAGALAGYVKRLVTDAVATVGERYGFVPDYPVVVELYPRHQDFAVRTSGLPGIGVLGVAFGDVVLMDSPSARSVVEGFDWASALWHEVAHVVTLGATNNLVSRWFSEGVSVFEEWQTGPSRFQPAENSRRRRPVPCRPHRCRPGAPGSRTASNCTPRRRIHPPDLLGPGHGVLQPSGTRLRVHRARLRSGCTVTDSRRIPRRQGHRRGPGSRARHAPSRRRRGVRSLSRRPFCRSRSLGVRGGHAGSPGCGDDGRLGACRRSRSSRHCRLSKRSGQSKPVPDTRRGRGAPGQSGRGRGRADRILARRVAVHRAPSPAWPATWTTRNGTRTHWPSAGPLP